MGARRRLLVILLLIFGVTGFWLGSHFTSDIYHEEHRREIPKCPSASVTQNENRKQNVNDKQVVQPVLTNKENLQKLGTIFQNDHNWTYDCITWNKKQEKPIIKSTVLFNKNSQAGEDPVQRRQIFQEIFDKKDWPIREGQVKRTLQVSGPGALIENAQGAIAVLHSVINQIKSHLGISKISLLDIACGDMQWMESFIKTRDDILYTGMDIVPKLIEYHKYHKSRLPRTNFQVIDIVTQKLNKSYDLVLCRDMLQHLWMSDALRALYHISSSGSKFLLVTTYPGTSINLDVDKASVGGRKSSYNLQKPPFSLTPPVCVSYDWNVEFLGLWPLPLRQVPEKA